MSLPPKKRASWSSQVASEVEKAPVISSAFEEGVASPDLSGDSSQPSITVDLKSFRFIGQDTGFFIAKCTSKDTPKHLPAMWRNRFNPNDVTIKGTSLALASMDHVGSTIECQGEWVMDPKFGLQFQFQWAREALPTTLDALEKYLSLGRIKGIGPATAKQIVSKFGMETLDVISTKPEKLLEISGITQTKLNAIVKEWEKKKHTYQLSSFFGLYNIGEVWIPKIIESLGPDHLEARVRENPYLLIHVDGIGFATADKMALALGLPRQSPKRAEAMLLHLLNDYTSKKGHTACPVDEWFRDASQQLGLSNEVLQPIAQNLINKKTVVLRNLPVSREDLSGHGYNDQAVITPCVSLRKEMMAERSVANNLARLLALSTGLGQEEQMIVYEVLGQKTQLDPSQVEGVLGVLQNPVSVLTGGPGTGKTTTLKSVIDIAEAMKWEVVLAAPTGRAAKRMEEAIGRPAATIHRTLKFSPKEGFQHNRNNPLFGKLFVIDEASMIDNQLGASWMSALPENARLVFVGDIDQLPSVGAGNFLKDIITSTACPVFRLNRVHRQVKGSLIADAASKILQGKMPVLDADPWKDDFAWLCPPQGMSSAEVNEFISSTIQSLTEGFLKKGYKKEDIQILSPQRDGLVGVNGLNDTMRWVLNEKGKPSQAVEDDDNFALGDRLLVNKNNYDKEIFNGDMGIVEEIDNEDGSMKLRMEDDRIVELERLDRKYLTFGYAITVHKSQGGERPVIIMPCSPSHSFSMNKNLLYTGITRGKDKVIVVGSAKTLHQALSKQAKMYRLTGLVDEIKRVIPLEKKEEVSQKKSFSPKRFYS